MDDLAEEFTVHRVTIAARLRRLAVPLRRQGIPDDDLEEAVRLCTAKAGRLSDLERSMGATPKRHDEHLGWPELHCALLRSGYNQLYTGAVILPGKHTGVLPAVLGKSLMVMCSWIRSTI